MRLAGIASAVWIRRAVTVPTCALLVYFLLLVISTHLPPTSLRPFALALKFRLSDKLGHACAYGGLTLLAIAVWRLYRPADLTFSQKLVWLVSLCFAVAGWGLLDEITQPYFGRQFDWFDWLANLIGISLGVTAAALIPRTAKSWWLVAFSLR